MGGVWSSSETVAKTQFKLHIFHGTSDRTWITEDFKRCPNPEDGRFSTVKMCCERPFILVSEIYEVLQRHGVDFGSVEYDVRYWHTEQRVWKLMPSLSQHFKLMRSESTLLFLQMCLAQPSPCSTPPEMSSASENPERKKSDELSDLRKKLALLERQVEVQGNMLKNQSTSDEQVFSAPEKIVQISSEKEKLRCELSSTPMERRADIYSAPVVKQNVSVPVVSIHEVPRAQDVSGIHNDQAEAMKTLRSLPSFMKGSSYPNKSPAIIPKTPPSIGECQTSPVSTSHLDIAVLYAQPLVYLQSEANARANTRNQPSRVAHTNRRAPAHYLPFEQPLSSPRELDFLVRELKKTEKQLSIRFDVATARTLSEIVCHRPRVLHVSCHGGFRQRGKSSEFFLAFEDETGALDYFTMYKLKQIMHIDHLQSVELVFINSCYSVEAAKIFHEAGVPFVVGVHSATKVLDSACETFATYFYLALVTGSSVQTAFSRASATVSSASVLPSCCCAHKHKNDCAWEKRVKPSVGGLAHDVHTPDARCKCRNRKDAIHDPKCKWLQSAFPILEISPESYNGHTVVVTGLPASLSSADLSEFCSRVGRVRKATVAKGEGDGLTHGFVKFERRIDAFRSVSELSGREIRSQHSPVTVAPMRLCCCSPELPHDESTKFVLLRNDSGRDSHIFRHLRSGQIERKSPLPPNSPLSVPKPFSGRNRNIFSLVYDLTKSEHHRVVCVYGEPGVGKKTLMKAVSNYIYERSRYRFDNGVISIDMTSKRCAADILFAVAEALSLELNSWAELFRALGEWRGLLQIARCGEIAKHDGEQLTDFLEDIRLRTRHVRVFMSVAIPLTPSHRAPVALHEVLPLSDRDAVLTFRSLAKQHLPLRYVGNPQLLAKHQIFRCMRRRNGTLPRTIWSIAPLLSIKGKTLDGLTQELQKKRQVASQDRKGEEVSPSAPRKSASTLEYSLDVLLNCVQLQSPEALKLLSLLSLFAGGFLEMDLDSIWCDRSWRPLMRVLTCVGGEADTVEGGQKIWIVKEKFVLDASSSLRIGPVRHYYMPPLYVRPLAEHFERLGGFDRERFYTSAVARFATASGDLVSVFRSNTAPDVIESAQQIFKLMLPNFYDCFTEKSFDHAFSESVLQDLRTGRLHPITTIGVNVVQVFEFLGRFREGIHACVVGIQTAERLGDTLAAIRLMFLKGQLYMQLQRQQDAWEVYKLVRDQLNNVRFWFRTHRMPSVGQAEGDSSGDGSSQNPRASADFKPASVGSGLGDTARPQSLTLPRPRDTISSRQSPMASTSFQRGGRSGDVKNVKIRVPEKSGEGTASASMAISLGSPASMYGWLVPPRNVPQITRMDSEDELKSIPDYIVRLEAQVLTSYGIACEKLGFRPSAEDAYARAHEFFLHCSDLMWAARALKAKAELVLGECEKNAETERNSLTPSPQESVGPPSWHARTRSPVGGVKRDLTLAHDLFRRAQKGPQSASGSAECLRLRARAHVLTGHWREARRDALASVDIHNKLKIGLANSDSALTLGKVNAIVAEKEHEVANFIFFMKSSPLVHITDSANFPPSPRVQAVEWTPEGSDEWSTLKEEAEGSEIKLRIQACRANAKELQRCMAAGCRIFHFSCRSLLPDLNGLPLEDIAGALHLVKASNNSLCSVLRQAGGVGATLVFLSCVVSHVVAEAFLEANASFVVIATDHEFLETRTAEQFQRTFYRELFEGKPVKDAFEAAKYECGPVRVMGYQLHCKKSGQHLSQSAALFDVKTAEKGGLEDVSPSRLRTNLSDTIDHYCGRNVEMYQALMILGEYRVVNLYGLHGMGKSALACSIGHYALNRNVYRDGVFFTSLKDCQTPVKLRSALARALSQETTSFSELLDQLRERKILLILDDCQAPDSGAPVCFSWFIHSALCLQKVHMILVSTEQLHALDLPLSEIKTFPLGPQAPLERVQSFADKPICLSVAPLRALDAAALFFRSSTRSLQPDELPEAFGGQEEPTRKQIVEVLSRHPLLDRLMGHPLSICRTALHLSDHRLDKMDDVFEKSESDEDTQSFDASPQSPPFMLPEKMTWVNRYSLRERGRQQHTAPLRSKKRRSGQPPSWSEKGAGGGGGWSAEMTGGKGRRRRRRHQKGQHSSPIHSRGSSSGRSSRRALASDVFGVADGDAETPRDIFPRTTGPAVFNPNKPTLLHRASATESPSMNSGNQPVADGRPWRVAARGRRGNGRKVSSGDRKKKDGKVVTPRGKRQSQGQGLKRAGKTKNIIARLRNIQDEINDLGNQFDSIEESSKNEEKVPGNSEERSRNEHERDRLTALIEEKQELFEHWSQQLASSERSKKVNKRRKRKNKT
eukprot:17076_1